MKPEERESSSLDSGSPGRYGAFLAMGAGFAFFGLGLYLLVGGLASMPFSFAFLVGGFVEVVTGWFTLRRVRAAWAFACSLNGTAAIVFLFGAPKIRDAIDVSIGLALLPAFLLGIITLLCGLTSDDF